MKAGLGSVITAATEATKQLGAPSPLHIAISLAVGVLIALAAGTLHRSDRPIPASPVRYSVQAAIMRAGIACFGTASLVLAMLMSPQPGVSLLNLLISTVAATIYGLLAYFDDSTVQASIWRGATAAASAVGIGQAFLALYTGR
ncbi:hypothetical protein PV726_47110 [Streptomyces europaeiscabiei]|uniref:hypothetical protein n=1 Tax=Streptomyces europaeiscabiei TaxID=146819 RepID=UPI0029AA4F79|nr:hypothetical protein [Streptomyces europaeiscabiei]MDX3697627.1 hypothetical protein [Streptomyces europaeiscabiei]